MKNRATVSASLLALALAALVSTQAEAASCRVFQSEGRTPRFQSVRPEVEDFHFDMPGMRIGSVSDSSLATGTTLFFFERGATAAYDARGGSVAAIETTLLDRGSYSAQVDGIMFAGGSTMGLNATDGVRRRIFTERGKSAGVFDAIPSIPGAVVYDFMGRIEPGQNQLLVPNAPMGAAAYDNAVPNVMKIGRVGAGTTTTANKISEPIWGGQGAGFREINIDGYPVKIFTAVVVNAHGDIRLPPDVQVNAEVLAQLREQAKTTKKTHRQATTLSLVVVDVKMDRDQLQRLATMVHTSMAGVIHPFQSYTDGDILFAASLNQRALPRGLQAMEVEEAIQIGASSLMRESIIRSVTVANRLGTPDYSGYEGEK